MAEKKEIPPIIESIKGIVDSMLLNTHTCLPGIVEKFDASQKTVDVKPALQRKYVTGEITELPVIPNVPIAYPQSSESMISFPLKVGDPVLLLFSERSIDIWKDRGGSISPEDPRKFDITDAIAIPGVFHIGGGVTTKPTSLVVKYKNFEIEITESGKLRVTNGSDDVVDIINDTIDELTKMTVNTMLGPQPPNNLAAFQALLTRIGAFI